MKCRLAADPASRGVRESLILQSHLLYFVPSILIVKAHGGVNIRLSSLRFLRINSAVGFAGEAFVPQSYDELVANAACII